MTATHQETTVIPPRPRLHGATTILPGRTEDMYDEGAFGQPTDNAVDMVLWNASLPNDHPARRTERAPRHERPSRIEAYRAKLSSFLGRAATILTEDNPIDRFIAKRRKEAHAHIMPNPTSDFGGYVAHPLRPDVPTAKSVRFADFNLGGLALAKRVLELSPSMTRAESRLAQTIGQALANGEVGQQVLGRRQVILLEKAFNRVGELGLSDEQYASIAPELTYIDDHAEEGVVRSIQSMYSGSTPFTPAGPLEDRKYAVSVLGQVSQHIQDITERVGAHVHSDYRDLSVVLDGLCVAVENSRLTARVSRGHLDQICTVARCIGAVSSEDSIPLRRYLSSHVGNRLQYTVRRLAGSLKVAIGRA